MKNPRGLGRGLDALMPEADGDAKESVVSLPVSEIDPNPAQPRQAFDQASLKELSDSIRQMGILQPILVCKREGRYRIIAGERRWRAARLAGLTEIPAIVRQMGDVERMEAALVENIQREDLNPIEEAQAVKALMTQCGLTQEAAAARLGRSRPALANLLRLLNLPEKVIGWIRDGKLSAGHARALAAVEDPQRCEALARRAIEEGWSVRRTEQETARAGEAPAPRKASRAAAQRPEFTELEDRLRVAFGMKASVKGDLEKGRILLEYTSRDALEKLFDALDQH